MSLNLNGRYVTDAEESLYGAVRRYNAACRLMDAGRVLVGPTPAEGALIDAARRDVVRCLDALNVAGISAERQNEVIAAANQRR